MKSVKKEIEESRKSYIEAYKQDFLKRVQETVERQINQIAENIGSAHVCYFAVQYKDLFNL